MNRRQKKKQYKKIHGYNPPKEWQVVAGGTALKNGDLVIPEENVERIAERSLLTLSTAQVRLLKRLNLTS